jgi:hypothetical protein
VEAKRFQLEGPSLAALEAQVAREHGATARIVVAEKVMVGGIRGFFARQHFEVTVEVPAVRPAEDTRRARRAKLDVSARLGIAALLAEADDTEARLGGVPESALSTDSDHFAALMDDLTFQSLRPDATPAAAPVTSAPTAVPVVIPVPLRGVGDLVVVIGLHQDAVTVAGSMAAADPSGGTDTIETAGALIGQAPDWDRRRSLAARAKGVERGRAVFVAFGLENPRNPGALAVQADTIRSIGADQVWVAVDAGRKAADTGRWVRSLAETVSIDGVAVVGRDATSSPETVDQLPVPVGWADGTPVRRGAPIQPDKLA